MLGCMKRVRFTPESRHSVGAAEIVRFVPLVDIRLLLVLVLDAWDADETDSVRERQLRGASIWPRPWNQ